VRKPPPTTTGTSREISSGAARSAEPPAPGPGQGLVGMSRQYDDLHCQQIQIGHGVRIPAAASILEVDGVRLPIDNPGALAESTAAILFLPRGNHLVRFRTSELPVEVTIASDLVAEYQAMRRYFTIDGEVQMVELLRRGGRTMDVHNAPFLLNFVGAGHAKEDRRKAAERHFRRALSINPAFSPAHLNLAQCLLDRNARDDAIRETLLADAFNVGNVFGLAEAIFQMRRKLGLPLEASQPIDAAGLVYIGSEQISEEDRRLVALLEGISKYAVAAEERAKILNNLAVHFDDRKKPELALHHFREALAAVKYSGTGRFAVARQILANMSRACRNAGFEEAKDYDQMQYLVTP